MLGSLSAKYESTGPGCVSDGSGDLGGVSYGCYQLATNAGTPQDFVRWLLDCGHPFGNMLAEAGEPGAYTFTIRWRYLADNYPDDFAKQQHEYAKRLYFVPAIKALQGMGLFVQSRSLALQQVIFSRAVQYGAYWMPELFESAAALAGQDMMAMTDYDLIWHVYEVLIQEADNAAQTGNGLYHSPNDWVNGSGDVVAGLRNRFVNERQDALDMLAAEGGTA